MNGKLLGISMVEANTLLKYYSTICLKSLTKITKPLVTSNMTCDWAHIQTWYWQQPQSHPQDSTAEQMQGDHSVIEDY